jgi:undecaprenyl diphosphate synthase
MTGEELKIPRHIGYIVDGNRRWAKKHGIPTYEGHLAGYNTLRTVILETAKQGVEYASIYAFSTENWKRGEGETGKLMKLALRLFKSDLKDLIKENIQLRVLGTDEGLGPDVVRAAREAEQATAQCTGLIVALCFNYGGQKEIVDAVNATRRISPEKTEITEEDIEQYLYSSDIPPVDIVVRTSGEHRLSNFMLWRTAYSELLFFDKYWPDMTAEDVTGIIEEYKKRSRRYGG